MSHDLNFKNGKASMFSAKEVPWHGLGTVVDRALTSKEALEAAQLNYTVRKGIGYLKYDDIDIPRLVKKGISVPNTYFTYRTDTGQSLCSNGSALTKDYNVIQNYEGFDFFDSIVGENKAIFETAGALRNGELVFITAKLEDSIFKNTPELIDQYLLMFLSHDGSSSVTIKYTPIRVVCNNTLQAALSREGLTAKIRHSKSYKDKLENAKEVLKLAQIGKEKLERTFEKFSNVKIDDDVLKTLIHNVILDSSQISELDKESINCIDHFVPTELVSTRKQNLITDLHQYHYKGIGQSEEYINTLWGFINGFTSYFQNQKSYIQNGEESKEKKLINLVDGAANNIISKSFQIANNFKI